MSVIVQVNTSQQGGGPHKIGLFDCFGDCTACCCGTFFLCCLSGRIKAELDGRTMETCDWCLCPSTYFSRQQMRSQFNMEKSSCSDLCAITFCGCCATIQDFREIKKRKNDAKMQIMNDLFKASQ